MAGYKLVVVNRKGETIQEFNQSFDGTITVDQFKKQFLKDNESARKKKLTTFRLRFTIGDPRGEALTDKTKTLDHYLAEPLKKLTDDSSVTDYTIKLYFKDLGRQVSWTTVFLVEYFGPILITGILIAFQKQIYGEEKAYTFNQKLGIGMVLLHYIKRELETLFVHRFSADTMPIMNIFKNSLHYWIIFGVFNMYFFLHPKYTAPAWATKEMNIGFAFVFVIFEFLNLKAHLILKNLRKPGTTERGIPKGWGFGLVSCANYFYESMAWLTFAIQAQVLGGYFFFAVSTYQMALWALKKHQRYRKEFPNYPKNRKSMFPFII